MLHHIICYGVSQGEMNRFQNPGSVFVQVCGYKAHT